MHFDLQGNLYPYEITKIDFKTFEDIFINDFPNSLTRKEIFDNYLSYLSAFREEVSNSFTQFIDGSFITKEENPRDLDFVTLLASTLYDEKYNVLEKYKGLQLHKEKKLDCYFIKEYPIEHPYYEIVTLSDKLYWLDLFSKTRVQRNGKKYPKGIIQIEFQP